MLRGDPLHEFKEALVDRLGPLLDVAQSLPACVGIGETASPVAAVAGEEQIPEEGEDVISRVHPRA